MTEAAERVKEFCERVITYENEYQVYWQNQKGIQDDDEACEISEQIRAEKIPYCRLVARARGEVYDLIKESNLTPLQRRIMYYRYNKAWTMKHITNVVHLTNRRVRQVRAEACERMIPTMDRMYPNWQIGDE